MEVSAIGPIGEFVLKDAEMELKCAHEHVQNHLQHMAGKIVKELKRKANHVKSKSAQDPVVIKIKIVLTIEIVAEIKMQIGGSGLDGTAGKHVAYAVLLHPFQPNGVLNRRVIAWTREGGKNFARATK